MPRVSSALGLLCVHWGWVGEKAEQEAAFVEHFARKQ